MNRLVAIGIGILILSMGGMYWRIMHLEGELEKAQGYESLYNASVKENKIWKDEAGLWRNKAEVAEVSARTLKDLVKNGDPEIQRIKDEFPALKKDLKNLLAYSEIQTKTISQLKGTVRDTVIRVVVGKDTTDKAVKKINTSNKWNIYDITIDGDSADIKREGTEEFETVVYWERLTKKGKKIFWPFGKKEWQSEIKSLNPETQVVKQKSLIVKKK